MHKFLPYLTIAILMLLPLPKASAQTDRMDRALDRYEAICDECISLKERSLRGEAISSEELMDLLGQVSSLRSAIQQGAGTMTPAQKRRFERIRNKYSKAFSKDTDIAAKESHNMSEAASSITCPPLHTGVRPLTLMLRKAAGGSSSPGKGATSSSPEKGKYNVGLAAIGGWSPGTFYGGGMLTLSLPVTGLYIKGISNFRNLSADYACSSDGTTEDGFIWTSGREQKVLRSIGVGAFIPVYGPWSIYAGPCYGSSTILWEDVEGKWAKVADYSAAGTGADAGLVFSKGRLVLSAGASTLSFKTLSLEFGIGLRFR